MRKSRCLRVANQILHFKRFGGGGCLGLDVRSRQLRSFVRFGASVKSRHSFSLRFWAVSGQSACSPETRKADLEKCSNSGAAVANISPNPCIYHRNCRAENPLLDEPSCKTGHRARPPSQAKHSRYIIRSGASAAIWVVVFAPSTQTYSTVAAVPSSSSIENENKHMSARTTIPNLNASRRSLHLLL